MNDTTIVSSNLRIRLLAIKGLHLLDGVLAVGRNFNRFRGT